MRDELKVMSMDISFAEIKTALNFSSKLFLLYPLAFPEIFTHRFLFSHLSYDFF